jgi:hypothetical protein
MRPAPDAGNGAKVASENDLPAFTGENLGDYGIRNNLRIEDLFHSSVRALSTNDHMETYIYSSPFDVVLERLYHRCRSICGVYDREFDLWRFVHDSHFLLEPLMQAHHRSFGVAVRDETRRANE